MRWAPEQTDEQCSQCGARLWSEHVSPRFYEITCPTCGPLGYRKESGVPKLAPDDCDVKKVFAVNPTVEERT